jgi:hypothetical protein
MIVEKMDFVKAANFRKVIGKNYKAIPSLKKPKIKTSLLSILATLSNHLSPQNLKSGIQNQLKTSPGASFP